MINIFIFFIILIIIISLVSYESFNNVSSTYLVSLERDKERRENLYKGITPREYYSVDGSKLLNHDDLAKNGILENKNLKKGEIGCYMSHYNILDKIKNYNDQYSLILEDDVFIDINKEKSHLEHIINNTPADWEIIFIGYNHYGEVEPKHQVILGNSSIKKVNLVFGTQSYLIKNSAIQQKLKNLYPIKEPIDIALPKIFTSYIVDPKISSLSDFSKYSHTQNIN